MTAWPVPADLAHLVAGNWVLDGDAVPTYGSWPAVTPCSRPASPAD
ncbi:hypothetical protein ABT294_43770 [Nonomuraea sp. NPDC000554]